MTATDNRTAEGAHTGAQAALEPPAHPDDKMTSAQWLRVAILGALLVFLTATTGIWGLVVVLGILAMVVLHELGHYIAAKRAGMKVTEFFIGFGPRIWSFRRGETEYGFKVIPAGAYVKIIGMHNLEEVDPADEARSYRQGRFRDRLAVVTAGPLMNFAAALVLIWVILAVVGAPMGSMIAKPDETRWNIDKIYAGTGAVEAGLKPGDKITAVDGSRVRTFDDLRPLIQPKQGKTVRVTYLRAGKLTTVPVQLHSYTAEDGQIACCLGVRQNLLDWKTKKVNPALAVPKSFVELGGITTKALGGLAGFFSPSGLRNFGHQVTHAQADKAASDAPTTLPKTAAAARASTAAASSQGKDRLISMVGVFHIGTSVAESGALALLSLFVLLNISLGIINLVPLLPFDGGHAAVAVYEKVQEKRRHLKGRYFTDVSRLLPATYVVVLILAAIFLTTTYLDIVNPLKIN